MNRNVDKIVAVLVTVLGSAGVLFFGYIYFTAGPCPRDLGGLLCGFDVFGLTMSAIVLLVGLSGFFRK